MASPAVGHEHEWLHHLSPKELGLVGQTSESWGVAGGLAASLVVSGHMVAGNLSSSIGFLTTTIFFVGGAVIGFLHGSLLAYLGRPPEVARTVALRRIGLAVGYAVPSLFLGWVVAMLLALSAVAFVAGRGVALLAALIGWVAASAFFAWAVVETRKTLRHLLQRWPDARAVLVTLGVAVVALVPVFLVTRPEIWVLGVKPTPTAATMMALAAALWIVGPLAILALLSVRAWRRAHPDASPTKEASHGH